MELAQPRMYGPRQQPDESLPHNHVMATTMEPRGLMDVLGFWFILGGQVGIANFHHHRLAKFL